MSLRRFAALPAVALVLAACGSSNPTTNGRARAGPRAGIVLVGEPLAPRPVEVTGRPATVELGVKDPARPALSSVLVTFVRGVRREPRDVCFGAFAANQGPAEGDVGCQVRGNQPLVLTLGEDFVPGSAPLARFIVVYGQADPDVAHLELIGPGARRASLPLSTHRMFLAAFSPSARGTVRLRAQLAGGTAFTHTFTLPLNRRELGRWPRLRRSGAVFDSEIGENIVIESYRHVLGRLGPPLKTVVKPQHVRCLYYDLVGYANGWVLCFRGQAMIAATANQAAPAGVR